MNFSAKGGGDFKTVPSGSHIAICNLVADLGKQPGGKAFPEPKQQIFIRFEIPAERIQYEKDGKKIDAPATIGATFTASMHENANLRKQLESWRGKMFTDFEAEAFDVSSILGKPCMLTVVEQTSNGKTYANIKAIGGLPRGMSMGPAENKLLLYSEDNRTMFDELPEWLRKKIDSQILNKPEPQRAPDYARGYVPAEQVSQPAYDNQFGDQGITDDDIPF